MSGRPGRYRTCKAWSRRWELPGLPPGKVPYRPVAVVRPWARRTVRTKPVRRTRTGRRSSHPGSDSCWAWTRRSRRWSAGPGRRHRSPPADRPDSTSIPGLGGPGQVGGPGLRSVREPSGEIPAESPVVESAGHPDGSHRCRDPATPGIRATEHRSPGRKQAERAADTTPHDPRRGHCDLRSRLEAIDAAIARWDRSGGRRPGRDRSSSPRAWEGRARRGAALSRRVRRRRPVG